MNESCALGRSARRTLRRTALVVAAVSVAFPGRAIGANPRASCFDAYERAQRLRQEHKLRASLDELQLCVDASCPAFVKRDCGQWLGEVEASLPSAVVLTKGSDAYAYQKSRTDTRVAVYVDGERVAERIDGHEIPIDPGPHDVRYELDGRSVEKQIVVPEGQKQFPLVVDFRELDPPPAPMHAPALAARSTEAHESRAQSPGSPPRYTPIPLSTYALGGISIAGFAAFAGFGITGKSAESCAPSCTHAQVGDVRTDYIIADVSLGVGIAAAAGALYVALTAKPVAGTVGAPKAPAAAWWLGAQPTVGGAAIGTGVRF
jgi:hypothetical protein